MGGVGFGDPAVLEVGVEADEDQVEAMGFVGEAGVGGAVVEVGGGRQTSGATGGFEASQGGLAFGAGVGEQGGVARGAVAFGEDRGLGEADPRLVDDGAADEPGTVTGGQGQGQVDRGLAVGRAVDGDHQGAEHHGGRSLDR